MCTVLYHYREICELSIFTDFPCIMKIYDTGYVKLHSHRTKREKAALSGISGITEGIELVYMSNHPSRIFGMLKPGMDIGITTLLFSLQS